MLGFINECDLKILVVKVEETVRDYTPTEGGSNDNNALLCLSR